MLVVIKKFAPHLVHFVEIELLLIKDGPVALRKGNSLRRYFNVLPQVVFKGDEGVVVGKVFTLALLMSNALADDRPKHLILKAVAEGALFTVVGLHQAEETTKVLPFEDVPVVE